MKERKRGFEIAKGFENSEINLPVRNTKYSAGYDFQAAEDCIIPAFKPGQKPTLVKTGIKSFMQDDEMLLLYNRSSNAGKRGLVLANGVGVVDKDYYGNESNDGAIMFAFFNIKDTDFEIKKGDVIGQGIFQKYLIADDDIANGERKGGFGSTDK
ncbi:MAG: dUTP diphosphatase [Clostridia bacterium]|nr:dUTP diphosphatase [Clostridia bacterium]